MKKSKVYKVEIEGLTLQDIIEILELKCEELEEQIKLSVK